MLGVPNFDPYLYDMGNLPVVQQKYDSTIDLTHVGFKEPIRFHGINQAI